MIRPFKLVLLLSLLATGSIAVQAKDRGLWVARFHFNNATDVVQIFQNAKMLGANQVYFQVRGNATVFYPSAIEPWAWELTSDSPKTIGKNPGWNPLATAIEEAKKNRLEIHAWMNVFPGWRGVVPAPRGTRHPWVIHRSWFMIDHRGVLLRPSKSFYSFLSPGNPQVRKYTASVFKEVVQKYPQLDGVHLDYIRYPGRKEVGKFRDFSYDKVSVAAFRKQYKKAPRYSNPDWQRFKCEQVNASLQAIRASVKPLSPSLDLSATCFADIHKATSEKGQDPRDWISRKLVDHVIPMVYERNEHDFQSRLVEWNSFFDPDQLQTMLIGVNVDFNDEKQIRKQLDYVNEHDYGGVIVFSYASLFPHHQPNRKAEVLQEIWHEQHLQDLLRKPELLQTQ